MASNEKLRAVCGSIIESFRSANKDYKEKYLNNNTPAFDKLNINIAYDATDEKLKRAYKKLIAFVPADKKTELHAKIETYFRATFKTEASFTSMKNRILAKPELKEKEFYIFEAPTNNFFVEGDTNKVFDTILDYLDGMELDGVAEDLENYKAACEYNHEIYPWANEIEELKKKNAETVTDEQKLKELNEELDIIAKTVVFSPGEYTKKYESYEDNVAHHLNVKTDEINDRQLETEQYRELNGYFKDYSYISNEVNYGVRHISDAHVTDTGVAKEFLKEDRKFIIPEDKKNAIRNILNFMKERGMLVHITLGESGDKSYSFTQIGTAQDKLHELIQSGSTDVDAIRRAREEYESTLQNMRDVYKMIEEQLAPDENTAVGNLSSYRTGWVPNEFKNNIFINGYANAIYNLGAMMDEVGIDFDEMLENPSEVFLKCMEHFSKNLTPNDEMKGYSPAAAIKTAGSLHNTRGYPHLGVARHGEFLRQLSVGTEYYEQNTMALLLTATYDNRVAGLVQNGNYSSVAGYMVLGDNGQTAANMMIVNDEDRDYNKLRSFEAITVDGMKKIPPFNATEYLENHKVDPEKLTERLNDTLLTIYNTSSQNMVVTVRAAQIAAYDFLMMHPTPDVEAENAFFTKEQFDALNEIVNTPEKALGKIVADDLSKKMNRYAAMSDYSKGIENTGEAALNVAELSKEEKAYCQKIEDIKKTLKGKEAESAISALFAKERARLEKDKKELNEFITKGLPKEMAKYSSMSEYKKDIERTGKDALKTARKEARAAEKAYSNQVDNIKKTLAGKEAEAALADLRAKEIERLEKAYCEGKLPSDYFEQRRFNVEQGKHDRKVPFGVDERPSFRQFKAENADALEGMSSSDIKFMYNNMMDNARRAENKFMLTAAGKQPKPTIEHAEPVEVKETQHLREHLDLTHDLNENVVEVSKQIVHENPQPNITKYP